MKRLQKQANNLTPEQMELGAKYFAVSNTGLIGCGFDAPQTIQDIKRLYDSVSYEYQVNMGEGLDEELEMWRKNMHKPEYETELRKRLPWLFEEK